MADDLKKQISNLWSGFRKKASDTVAHQEASFARGKIAGSAVVDDEGVVIVEAGHRIDDTVIERATAAGKLHALTSAAATAQAQDLREKVQTRYNATEDGREARSLDSVEDFVEARRYVGRIAVMDVTDIRGNVVVAGGTEVREEHIHKAREAGQLGALIYSAKQPQPKVQPAPPKPVVESTSELPVTAEPPQAKRASLPLMNLPPSNSTKPDL